MLHVAQAENESQSKATEPADVDTAVTAMVRYTKRRHNRRRQEEGAH